MKMDKGYPPVEKAEISEGAYRAADFIIAGFVLFILYVLMVADLVILNITGGSSSLPIIIILSIFVFVSMIGFLAWSLYRGSKDDRGGIVYLIFIILAVIGAVTQIVAPIIISNS